PFSSSCCFSASLNISRFQVQQQPLPFQAAAETYQAAGCTNYAVAGHDDGNWIPAIGSSNRAHGLRGADLRRDLAVAARLPVGNGPERAPYPLLKLRTRNFERNVERF